MTTGAAGPPAPGPGGADAAKALGEPSSGPPSEVLARATGALQDAPEPAWPAVMQRVSRTLRQVSRPGRPLLVADSAAGRLLADQRVVVDVVRRALDRVPGCRPVGVAVSATGTAVTSLQVDVWVGYGEDVLVVAAAVRSAATGSLVDVLGRAYPVDVVVVDVDPG